MKISSWQKVCNNFDKTEFKEFMRFVKSPYHNTNQKLIEFVQWCYSLHPKLTSKNFNEKIINQLFFKEDKDKVKPSRYLLAHLGKVYDQFVIYEEMRKDSWHEQIISLRLPQLKMNSKSYDKTWSNAFNDLNKRDTQNKYEKLSILWYEKWKQSSFYSKDFKADAHELLKNNDRAVCTVFLNKHLQWCATELYLNKLWAIPVQKEKVKDFLHSSIIKEYQDVFIIQIRILILKTMLDYEDDEAYGLLKEQLFRRGTELSRDEKVDVVQALETVNIMHHFNGKNTYKELQSILEYKVDHDLLLVNGILKISDFKNCVTISLKSESYTWGLKFVEEYQVYLNQKSKDETVAISTAELAIASRSYEDAIDFLNKVNFKQKQLYMQARHLELKAHSFLHNWTYVYNLSKNVIRWIRSQSKMYTSERRLHIEYCQFLMSVSDTIIKNFHNKKVAKETINELMEESKNLNNEIINSYGLDIAENALVTAGR